MPAPGVEDLTRIVYGETFDRYDPAEFLDFLRPLEVRLRSNGIPQSSFEGKHCLDAGCGGGRGSILMGRAGAGRVVAYDLSERNVRTTARNAARFGLDNLRPQCGSLLEIPFADETFDVVWCNGVIHHTRDGDRALQEITRVLKRGGHLWLYVYGAGGIYWYLVDFLREWLREIDPRMAIVHLNSLGTPTGRLAEFVDDWFVPVLDRYSDECVTSRLKELGLPDAVRLKGGMPNDTSVRRERPGEGDWMGFGDLRYWVRKTDLPGPARRFRIEHRPGHGRGPDDSRKVLSFQESFDSLDREMRAVEADHPGLYPTLRLTVAARLHGGLSEAFSRETPFDPETLAGLIGSQIRLLRSARGREEGA